MSPTTADAVQRLVAEMRAELTRACDYHETRNPAWTLAGAVRDIAKRYGKQIERMSADDGACASLRRCSKCGEGTCWCLP